MTHRLDLDNGLVQTDVGPIALSPIEVGVLRYLGAHPGRPVSREELLREVWGYAAQARSRTVDTAIQRLRAKVEPDPARPARLVTVRGEGYAWTPDAAPPPPLPPRAARFPRLDQLVGRDVEVRDLVGLLHGGHRLVTLVGPSGVGKTWTARRALTRIADIGRRAVWFADVAHAVTASDLLNALAVALELPVPLTDPERQVRDRLRETGPAVGVVDDAQGLDDDALRLLSSWVRTTADLALLVTSQRVLGLEGERLQPVEPLSTDGALAVFRDRLAALAIPAPASVAALVERLGGLPLALALAAPLLDTVPLDELLADPDLLAWSTDRPDAAAHHRSLGAAIAASVSRLEPVDRAALLRLSVFAGPFPPSAAAALDAEASLAPLRRRSFLQRHGDGRLALYDGIRAWAREALRAGGGWADAARRHAGWLATRAAEGATDLLQADLVQALQDDPGPDLKALIDALLRLAGHRGPISRLTDVVGRLLRADRPPRERIVLLHALSDAHLILGQPNPEPALESLALANQHGDEGGAILALALICSSYLELADPRAAPYAREAVARAERLGDYDRLYKALHAQGHTLDTAGDPAAIATHERIALLAERAGRPLHAAVGWASRGRACATQGDSEAAIADYRRSIAVAGDDHPRFAGLASVNLGGALADLGRLEEAEQAFATAHRLLGRVGDRAALAHLELRRIDVDLWRRKTRRAERRLRALLDGDALRPGFREMAQLTLAVLAGDEDLLPDDGHPFSAAAAALIAGRPLPEGVGTRLLDRLSLLARAREGR